MLEKKAAQIRLDCLRSMHKAGFSYIGASMSIVEILVALYYGELMGKPVIKFDASKPGWSEQDYFVLSKKQAVPVQYAILADLGFFDKSELEFLGKGAALLQDHPVGKVPGMVATIPSDGMGLSVAAGIALSLKMERKMNRVFAVVGDYELQRGQIWEATMLASRFNLDNLICMVDDPAVEMEAMRIEKIQDKFEAFGWRVVQVRDGHDFDQILDALNRAFAANRKPVCLWCHTVAGKGLEFAERKRGYLRARLSDNEISYLIPKLQELI